MKEFILYISENVKILTFIIVIGILFSTHLNLFGQNNAEDGNKQKINRINTTIDIATNSDTIFVTRLGEPGSLKSEIISVWLGSPFYKNKYFTNAILYVDGSSTEGNVLFDLINHQLNYKPLNTEATNFVQPDSFKIENKIFKKLYKNYKNAYYKYYYEKIFDQNGIVLYKNLVCDLEIMPKPKEIFYCDNSYSINFFYNRKSQFFLVKNDKFIDINSSNKFFNSFGKNKKKVKEFVILQNLNFKNERDLIKILKLYI